MAEKLKEERSVNKELYRIFLTLLKYTPLILLINDVIHTILSYYEYNVYIFNYFGGVTIMFLLILYIISYVFKFCYLYRLPLYYITITNIIALYDSYFGIPITDLLMLRMYFGILGIFIVSFVYLKFKKKC